MKFTNEAMSIEFCPVCRANANMSITISPKAGADRNGKMKMINVKTYHCESCRFFVRSIGASDFIQKEIPSQAP